MATLAELIARRDALEASRYSGRRAMGYEGEHVEYKSDAEMKAALSDLNRQINAASGRTSSPFVSFTTSKGV